MLSKILILITFLLVATNLSSCTTSSQRLVQILQKGRVVCGKRGIALLNLHSNNHYGKITCKNGEMYGYREF